MLACAAGSSHQLAGYGNLKVSLVCQLCSERMQSLDFNFVGTRQGVFICGPNSGGCLGIFTHRCTFPTGILTLARIYFDRASDAFDHKRRGTRAICHKATQTCQAAEATERVSISMTDSLPRGSKVCLWCQLSGTAWTGVLVLITHRWSASNSPNPAMLL